MKSALIRPLSVPIHFWTASVIAVFHASAATTPKAAVASEIIVATYSRLNRVVRRTIRPTAGRAPGAASSPSLSEPGPPSPTAFTPFARSNAPFDLSPCIHTLSVLMLRPLPRIVRSGTERPGIGKGGKDGRHGSRRAAYDRARPARGRRGPRSLLPYLDRKST